MHSKILITSKWVTSDNQGLEQSSSWSFKLKIERLNLYQYVIRFNQENT